MLCNFRFILKNKFIKFIKMQLFVRGNEIKVVEADNNELIANLKVNNYSLILLCNRENRS